jgi:hypothetical protein
LSKAYRTETPIEDSQFIDDLKELIEDIVKEEIRKAPFNKSIVGKITAVAADGLTADVQLLNSPNTITGVKVRSGLSLAINDSVYVTFLGNSSTNFFIDVKK